MVPPQERPTFHAVSSATPNSSTFGLPLSITSSASATTAPSTQPPDTEPRKFPSSSITRLEPTGRGAEPQVSTTVASATPLPALRQSSAALRMSSSRASESMAISLSVIARNKATKQSPPHPHVRVKRDCFAEFTLGLVEGKTRGLAMTKSLDTYIYYATRRSHSLGSPARLPCADRARHSSA